MGSWGSRGLVPLWYRLFWCDSASYVSEGEFVLARKMQSGLHQALTRDGRVNFYRSMSFDNRVGV
jgi:hypothetical protein